MCLDRADPAQPNTCTQGVWVTGNGVSFSHRPNSVKPARPKTPALTFAPQPKWPCPGDDTILCCVKYQDMINGTTSNPALTATRSTISASTTGETPPASPSGLSGSQIGGVVGGVVGAALLLALTVLFWLFRRKKRAGENAAPDANAVPEWPPMSPATAGDADHHNQHMLDGTVLGEMASGDTKKEGLGNCPMIDGNPLTEMDAIANMRHELASSGTPVLHELSGSTVDRMPEKR